MIPLRMRVHVLLIFIVMILCGTFTPARAQQQPDGTPGRYDFYLLNLAWSPEFCDTLNTLTPQEQAVRASTDCSAPHAFVVHGLWPQNLDGSYPANCSSRPGPRDWTRYLDMTPNLDLLKHEWFKHGTCTTLSPDAFFSTVREAYTSVVIPPAFKHREQPLTLEPDAILKMFYVANPGFPQGSFALACNDGGGFTAIEACFSRSVQPVACQAVRSCRAGSVTVAPEAGGRIVR